MGPSFSYQLIGDNGIAKDGYESETKHTQPSDWHYDSKYLVVGMNEFRSWPCGGSGELSKLSKMPPVLGT